MKNHDLEEKFNIFDMKKDDDDDNESSINNVSNEKFNPRLKESSINLGSADEEDINKFSPHKTQEIKTKKKGHLQIR